MPTLARNTANDASTSAMPKSACTTPCQRVSKHRWTGRAIGGQVPATDRHSSDKIKYSESITMANNGAFYLHVNIQQNTLELSLQLRVILSRTFKSEATESQPVDSKGEKDALSPLS